jgi:hypothetical protein
MGGRAWPAFTRSSSVSFSDPARKRVDKPAFLRQFPGALENVKLHGQGNWSYMREGLNHG